MKKKLFLFVLLFIPIITLGSPQIPSGFITGQPTPEGLVATIVNGIANIFMALAVLVFIGAGFNYLSSGGDPKKVEVAQRNLIMSVVGVGVALLAYALPFIIARFISG